LFQHSVLDQSPMKLSVMLSAGATTATSGNIPNEKLRLSIGVSLTIKANRRCRSGAAREGREI